MPVRRWTNYYPPRWELFPMLLMLELLFFTGWRILPDLKVAYQYTTANDPERQQALMEFLFCPVVGTLLYLAATAGAWISLHVKDPMKDLNWIVAKFDPDKVVTDPAVKERYLAGILRSLFLIKISLLIFFLVFQFHRYRQLPQ